MFLRNVYLNVVLFTCLISKFLYIKIMFIPGHLYSFPFVDLVFTYLYFSASQLTLYKSTNVKSTCLSNLHVCRISDMTIYGKKTETCDYYRGRRGNKRAEWNVINKQYISGMIIKRILKKKIRNIHHKKSVLLDSTEIREFYEEELDRNCKSVW